MKDIIAIYCRISSQLQSTDRQKEELLAIATKNGWEVPEDRIYVDIISGFKAGELRPEYSRMISELSPKGITCGLFSEFTRLARNATELLNQINFFREKNVRLFFEKQNIWVENKKNDLGNSILLHVLAVVSSYEVELFAERSQSGRISKVQAGGGGGIEYTFGYKLDAAKKLVVDEEEAQIVIRIFKEYAEGKSSIKICDMLNAEGVPSPYKKRLSEKREHRRKLGLKDKQYKNYNIDELVWRPSSLNRLLEHETYIGRKHIVYHKPDPTNPTPIDKRMDREIVYEYDEYDENLRLVSDEIWFAVQERKLNAHYNKNNAVKRENLLKHLLTCGECGSNFSVTGGAVNSQYSQMPNKYERKYTCYGRKKTSTKSSICNEGGEFMMTKLDGLVLQFSLKMFSEINLRETNETLLAKIRGELSEIEKVKESKQQELLQITEDFKGAVKSYAKLKNDKLREELIDEEQVKYEQSSDKLNGDIEKAIKEIAKLKANLRSIGKLNDNVNLYTQMHDIRGDRGIIKAMVDEYIDEIVVYRMHELWFLIVVKYRNGVELWGKLKKARYRNEELFYDEFLCRYGVEFQTWVIDNTAQTFHYDKARKIIIYDGGNELYSGLPKGEYDYERMNQYMIESQNMGSFSLYLYEDISLGSKSETA